MPDNARKLPITLTRDELYAKVWAVPMSRLAEQYGISGNGLAKICDRLAIPYPPRGYWARKAAGKKISQSALPPPAAGKPVQVTITPTVPALPPATLAPELVDALAAARTVTANLTVPDRLPRPHPIIAGWLKEHRDQREYARRWHGRGPAPADFTPIERRRHRILNALFTELEKHGYAAKEGQAARRKIRATERRQGRVSIPAPRLPTDYTDHDKPRIAVILGAGFSRCAGLPLQAEFADELLTNVPDDRRNRIITSAIDEFLKFTFGWSSGTTLPALEDIFTMIDLSAGTGHALGRPNTPRRLRALRRMLIHRVFSILDRRFKHAPEIDALINRTFARDPNPSFIVMNWDIVLERHLQDWGRGITYQADECPWGGNYSAGAQLTPVIKVHGSSNWVYCDNCRQVYWDPDRKLSLHINAGLEDEDFKLFDAQWTNGAIHGQHNCPRCGLPVGPHIATFSYRKSFRSAAFAMSWARAEEALSAANRWLFVGYSLPHADFEFTHLMKTAELKIAKTNLRPIRMDVVLKNDKAAEVRFRQMFGSAISSVSQAGLGGYVKRGLGKFLG